MSETGTPVSTAEESAPAQDEEAKHGQKLIVGVGSKVTLDYETGRVYKTYKPKFAVRALYWLAFQSSFPYSTDRDSLEASVQRRVIVGLLTKYWFGIDIVAPVLGVEQMPDGQVAFVTQLVHGTQPEDENSKYRARRFLKLLTGHFIEAGMPTWQVSPHNPRSVGNLMEVADGSYRIIDLESNLVAALTPASAVLSAIRAKNFPNFDDIDVNTLEAYLAKNSTRLRQVLGSEDYLELNNAALAYAEYASRWHAREPRLIGKLLKFLLGPVYFIESIVRYFKRLMATSQVRAEIFIRRGINHWLHEGLITQDEAVSLRRSLQDPETSKALFHLGTQLALSVPLFFPLSSIERLIWTTWHRLSAEVKGLITRRAPREARDLHTLPIAIIGLLPFSIGASAYLLSKPLRSNHQLGVIAVDRAFRKLPFKLYRRLGLSRLTLRMAKGKQSGGR